MASPSVGGGRLVDLSHPVHEGMTTYPGLPAPRLYDFMSREASREHYAPGVEFHIGGVEMVANTGTYLDSPYHRSPGGQDVAGLPLDRLAGLPGRLVRPDAGGSRGLGPQWWAGDDLEGKALLIETGWWRHWGSEAYFRGHPYLERAAAESLVEAGVALVGIDSLNIDSTDDPERPAHSLLLGAGIPIVEHLTGLDALPEVGFRFYAVPAPVVGLGSFPVRAFAAVG